MQSQVQCLFILFVLYPLGTRILLAWDRSGCQTTRPKFKGKRSSFLSAGHFDLPWNSGLGAAGKSWMFCFPSVAAHRGALHYRFLNGFASPTLPPRCSPGRTARSKCFLCFLFFYLLFLRKRLGLPLPFDLCCWASIWRSFYLYLYLGFIRLLWIPTDSQLG